MLTFKFNPFILVDSVLDKVVILDMAIGSVHFIKDKVVFKYCKNPCEGVAFLDKNVQRLLSSLTGNLSNIVSAS